MLRGSIRPAAGNVVRLSRTLRKLERGVATGSGDQHKLGNIKAPSSRGNSQQNAELPKESKSVASVQDSNAVKAEIMQKKKTMLELDEEMRLKLEGISGEGGNAGVEYEGGKAVGLKRGVKENMFRVI